jgi:hypothetical protein
VEETLYVILVQEALGVQRSLYLACPRDHDKETTAVRHVTLF